MKKKEFLVTVEKPIYCTGTVKVKATDIRIALKTVKANIKSGKLQDINVNWEEPEYQEGPIKATGGVEEINTTRK